MTSQVTSQVTSQITTENLDAMLTQYIETALWSSLDSADDPMDLSCGERDVHADTVEQMHEDCKDFAEANAEQIRQWGGKGDAWAAAGHDLWLTRNGHGTGFWDRDAGAWPNGGTDLAQAAKDCGGCDLYIGDDGMVYTQI